MTRIAEHGTREADLIDRAAAALDLLGRAAFLDYDIGFHLALEELEQLAVVRFKLTSESRWRLGRYFLLAAGQLRSLGPDWYGMAEKFLGLGWHAGGLVSSGKPPLPNEAASIVSYAFLLGATGRIEASRTTLSELHDAVIQHGDPTPLNTDIVYTSIRQNFAWWDAALQLVGGYVAEGSDAILSVDPAALSHDDLVALAMWRMTARGWRGELDEAHRDAEWIRANGQVSDWRGEPPRLSQLTTLISEAELELIDGDREALATTLDAAAGWAAEPSPLFEPVIAAQSIRIALTCGLHDGGAAHAALVPAADALLSEKAPAAPRCPPNAADVRHRYPALVRAALIAVRRRDSRADHWLARCTQVLHPADSLLDSAWGDESRYLLARTQTAHDNGTDPEAVLDQACHRIAGADTQRIDRARQALVRLGDIWLDDRPS